MLSNTQLKLLQVDNVAPLLREMLPSTWIRRTDVKLPWTPGYNKHPSTEWLTRMWNWLTKNQTRVPLTTFQGIPLIPLANNSYITQLQQNSMIFRKQQHLYASSSACLTESVCLFLETVGAVVVHHDLPSCIISHPKLNSIIQAPTPEGVLNILEASRQKVNLPSCVANMTMRAKEELRILFAQLKQVTRGQQDILKQLPLFLSSEDRYVPASKCMSAVPTEYFGIPVKCLKYGRIILRDSSYKLALLLGIHKESAVELLSKNILPAVAERFYNDRDSMDIMKWVLLRPEYDVLVNTLKFIPTADHQLSSSTELFEPNNRLCILFRYKNVFPTDEYSKGRLLDCLKRVGLKNESHVTSADVLDIVKELSTSQAKGRADVERGTVLLQHINCFPHLLLENVRSNRITKPLYKFLEDMCWLPCEASPPTHYPVSAGWVGNSNTLYSPRQVGLIETAFLQGSVLPLIKLPGIRQELLSAFSWSADRDSNNYQKVELVVHQLKNVAEKFELTEEAFAMSSAVSMIYEFLGKASSDIHFKHLFATHINTSQPWVWHGSGFTTSDKMALNIGTLGVSLVPYLHIVPRDILKHSNFLSKMGVQQTFQETALCTVLLNVQQKHKDEQISSDEEDFKVDLHLVNNILRYIANLDNFDSQKSEILVPCRISKRSERSLHMVRASECLYVDEERLAKQLFDEGLQEDFDKPVIHELISNDLAQRLGLQLLSHFIAPVEALEYEMAGPHETAVNAIKHNLDMYKQGVDIFKELIQNADDAGATEVKFLIDWRRNEETGNNLLSDGMKACHGPSIWAYNNACFSKEDIKNICSIAAQSKKHQLDKVGRFGLGFTSVYHLTDVPSVVSGPYVLICDPRTTHLGSRVQPGNPGIKLDLTNVRHRNTLRSYPNQFQPYNGIFGCNLQSSTKGFDHTLIRLPLRTDVEANNQYNQLSTYVYDTKKAVQPLIESLKKASATLLLFTQNVVHVSVQELDSPNVSDTRSMMSVTVTKIIQMPRSISGQGDMKTERNLLKATTACMKDSSLTALETTMVVKVTQETYATGILVTSKKKHYIISSCMIRGQILELARSPEGLIAGVLPCGGVAAELFGTGVFTPKPIEGSAFSYLPLDVTTGLPFHVNGNFLLQPNRRQLWSKPSSSTGEFEARWNICFIKSVLCRAFLNLLQDLQVLQLQNKVDAHNFQSLWPRKNRCESDFLSLVDAYYHAVGSESPAPAVIFSGSKWVSVHDCFFTDWNLTDPSDLKSSVVALLSENLLPKHWVELDTDVVSSIAPVDANRFFDNNTFTVERFLREVFFEMLEEGSIETTYRDRIILHVLDLRLGERKITDYDDILKTTDCIPYSLNEDDLVSPDQLVPPLHVDWISLQRGRPSISLW